MRFPDWAVSFIYYVDGRDRGGKSRLSWAVRSVAASSVRRVYREWKTASPELIGRLAHARAVDEAWLYPGSYYRAVARIERCHSPHLERRAAIEAATD
jgi:hypothetical protein